MHSLRANERALDESIRHRLCRSMVGARIGKPLGSVAERRIRRARIEVVGNRRDSLKLKK